MSFSDAKVQLLTLLSYFLKFNKNKSLFLRESQKNRQKSSNLYKVDYFKIARLCGFQKTQLF